MREKKEFEGLSRREFLQLSGMGIAGIGLAGILLELLALGTILRKVP